MKTNCQYIILPVVLVALRWLLFLAEVKLSNGCRTDMFIEIIDTADTYRA